MTRDVLQKLEDAFCNALPDREACIYAGIAPSTLYAYQERFPKFSERKTLLKLTPNIAARRTLVASLGDVKVAQWWLERKDPELRSRSQVEHKGEIKTDAASELDPDVRKAIKQYEEIRRRQIMEQAKKMAENE